MLMDGSDEVPGGVLQLFEHSVVGAAVSFVLRMLKSQVFDWRGVSGEIDSVLDMSG